MVRVVVIGAGHNGLVNACYLALAGYEVTVFEKRKVVGGCCVTETDIFPGFKVSSASYVNSLFCNRIVEDLNLRAYGYKVLLRDPSSFTPLPGNENYLFLGRDLEFNQKEIAKFSVSDSQKYEAYEVALDEIAQFLEPTFSMTPPTLPPKTMPDLATSAFLIAKFISLGLSGSLRFLKLMSQDARLFLDSWFESDVLKATLLTDATIGAAPMDFSGYVLLHHVMGEAGGTRGVWGYQRGGMGAISNALAQAAKNLGVKICTDTPVKKILTNSVGVVYGVMLQNGKKTYADCVVSNADPKVTFFKLLPGIPKLSHFYRKIAKLDFSSAVTKVNIALSGLPDFKCCPGIQLGPQHRGTIHISPSVEYIVNAAQEGAHGVPSTKPTLEITIPSSVDDTLAPDGCHLMNVFIQYTPYHLAGGQVWTKEFKEAYFQNNILGVMREYISNIDDIILDYQILSPFDLEQKFSLTEGNIFHGAMRLSQLFSLRPLRGYANYRTPIHGLYLCGAGTHPGGGVVGVNGLNAAREVIRDLS
ncbi:MAG: NAD(P)/FAD-dependent oxidoreductase [Parcubacteria group bacterium]|nr:NAD(P)/FAD-dependent oxidoreductase [Parcubacteria group bacterium]